MQLTINGEPQAVSATDIPALLAGLRLGAKRVAVELNGEVVPRSRWPEVSLRDGDHVEIVQAIGGG